MTGVELTEEQRVKWRKDAEDDLRMMISQLGARACRQILALLDALDAAEAEVAGLHSWSGLLSLLDEHWPEGAFPTLTDDAARDTGPRLVSALRRLDSANVAADQITEWREEEAAENARLTAELAHWKRVAGHVRLQAEQQEARAARAEALVEAGLGLADEWETAGITCECGHYPGSDHNGLGCYAFRCPCLLTDDQDPDEIAANRLRAALGGAK